MFPYKCAQNSYDHKHPIWCEDCIKKSDFKQILLQYVHNYTLLQIYCTDLNV